MSDSTGPLTVKKVADRVALAPRQATATAQPRLLVKSSFKRTLSRRRNDENIDSNMAPPSAGHLGVALGECYDSGGSGYNSPDEAGEGVAVEIEYVKTADLPNVDDSQADLQTLVARLDSKDWLTVCQALNNVRQLAVFHTEEAENMLEGVVARILKAMKNPRSALQKTALLATADLFHSYRDKMLLYLDTLLLQLFLKASQDKQFVCEEADRSLAALTASVSPACAIQSFLPYCKHKNPRVRAKAAVALQNSVARLGPVGIEEFGLEKLLQVAAAEVNEKLPEARDAGKRMVTDLHSAFNQRVHPEEGCCSPSGGDVGGSEDSASKAEGDDTPAVQQSSWERFCHNQLSAITAQAVIRATAMSVT